MPNIKTIEARLPVADVQRSAEFFVNTLQLEVRTLWPEQAPEFAILGGGSVRLQVARTKKEGSPTNGASTIWLDVDELDDFHQRVQQYAEIEWGPEVYFYGRRELGFRDPDGNLVILSEIAAVQQTRA